MKKISLSPRVGVWLIASLGFMVLTPASRSATLTLLYSFQSGSIDANNPSAGLVMDANGNLFGPSYAGGSAGGLGAIFELSPPAAGQTQWAETMIHGFSAVDGQDDGAHPQGSLLVASNGTLYGTTSGGGGPGNSGGGTVFQLAPPTMPGTAWTLTTLHVFSVNKVGLGHTPNTRLLMDTAGALYGATPSQGAEKLSEVVPGLVYKLSPPASGHVNWIYRSLYKFPVSKHGTTSPISGLVSDANGALYGTFAVYSTPAKSGVFKLTPPAAEGAAWTEASIFMFPDSSGTPVGELTIDESGAIYGVTDASGGSINGTVYKLTPPGGTQTNWTQTILGKFETSRTTANPNSGVLFGSDGQLYGNTLGGEGTLAAGTTYQLTPPAGGTGNWTNQTLVQFKFKPAGGGQDPLGTLVLGSGGSLYGVTGAGGASDVGTVFEIMP